MRWLMAALALSMIRGDPALAQATGPADPLNAACTFWPVTDKGEIDKTTEALARSLQIKDHPRLEDSFHGNA